MYIFDNISVISCRSVLLVENTGRPGGQVSGVISLYFISIKAHLKQGALVVVIVW
jgi:hypothetical protein